MKEVIEELLHRERHETRDLVFLVGLMTLELNKIMSALDNLNAAITTLQNSVDAAVTDITTPHPTDAQVQAAADAINAQSARLDNAVNPPPASPAPAAS